MEPLLKRFTMIIADNNPDDYYLVKDALEENSLTCDHGSFPMKKIVIASDRKEDKRGLASMLRVLFPECEIRVVSRRDSALSPHRVDDDHGEGRISPLDYE